ncbi:MAG TPA: DUF3093 family protein [Bryobacteraceae bacterium]|nr:DUF3093 family protein [Bryobacteraceae bacterium]HUO28314.1 DUF3093 family protein [Bryobacteraceae bacterium]
MPVPITRYRVPCHYLWAGLVALALGGFFFWFALIWPLYWIATGLFLASAGVVLYAASRPPIEIYDSHVKIGEQAIPWRHIRRLDRSMSLPLMVRLTLADKRRILVVYPGTAESSGGLLRSLRRHSREALIDGVPYRQFWGETASSAAPRKQLAAPRHPLLLPEDEAEVERMFQRLKSVGHLDQKTSSEDK